MGDKSLGERVVDLEYLVGSLKTRIADLEGMFVKSVEPAPVCVDKGFAVPPERPKIRRGFLRMNA
jgi:hypothetical protein